MATYAREHYETESENATERTLLIECKNLSKTLGIQDVTKGLHHKEAIWKDNYKEKKLRTNGKITRVK